MATTEIPTPRLKAHYDDEVRDALQRAASSCRR